MRMVRSVTDVRSVTALHIRFVCVFVLAQQAIGDASAARLRLFEHENFAGRTYEYMDAASDLGAGGQLAESVRVGSGRWLLCAGADFSGDCAWLSFDVRSLPHVGFTERIASLRPEAVPLLQRNWGAKGPPARTAIAIFSDRNFRGDWVAYRDNIEDLEETAPQLSVNSLVVQRGVWKLCTGPSFQGRCLITTASVWDLSDIFTTEIRSLEKVR